MKQVLVVAGLDPSGGAGLIADTRTAQLCGSRALGAVTALTVQDTRGVRAVEPVSSELLGAQLSAILSDVEIDAVKIGMLATAQVARAVAAALDLTAAPVVWDPVGAPTTGSVRLFSGALSEAAQILAPHLTVITPNLDEARALSGLEIDPADPATQSRAALAIADRYACAAVVTGGHLSADAATDAVAHGGECTSLTAPRIETNGPVHGTGCAHSTALACALAAGRDVDASAVAAGRFVRERLGQLVRVGRGRPSVI